MKFLSLLFACSVAGWTSVFTQELDCEIKVNYEAISTTNQDKLVDFQQHISDYLNGFRWGPDNLDEKIKCTITVHFTGSSGDRYTAQVFVGSQRKILDAKKSTAVLRLFDESWEFAYLRTAQLNHDPYTFSEVESFLDYYAYIVIGFDYDTYEENGGTPFFEKAMNVAKLGQATGQKGWQERTSGSFSKTQYIGEVLDLKYAPIRSALYTYHFAGLDSMVTSPQRGFANVIRSLEKIASVSRKLDPSNRFVKSVFDTKYLEIAEIFLNYPDRNVYLKLSQIDPTHTQTYEEYRTRSR